MKKTAMFYLKNCDLNNVSNLKNVFFSTAIITQLEGGAMYV